MCEHPDVLITGVDVFFFQRQLRLTEYGIGTLTQAFVKLLDEDERIFYKAIDCSPSGKIWRVFWIYKDLVQDWKQNQELLQIDNTYKVNRFNLPLLQVTGVISLHTTFSAAFALAAKEDTPAFLWILGHLKEAARQALIPPLKVIITDFNAALKKALTDTFPLTQQQICKWHILKNIVLNIAKKWVRSLDNCDLLMPPLKKKKKEARPSRAISIENKEVEVGLPLEEDSTELN